MKPTLIALTTLLASAITTASGKGVALADIETLYAEASRVTNLGENRKNDIWLLLKNGQAYQNLSVSPADFDVDTTRQHEPDKWYSWRKTDDGYQIRKNGAWQKLQARRILPGKAGETLHGSYRHNASDTPYYAHITLYTTINFAPDATFTDGSYTVSRSPVTTIGNTMPLHPGSEIVGSTTGAGGRYRIDGYTIEMTRPDGKTHRERFFFWDEDKESFNIGDATWSAY